MRVLLTNHFPFHGSGTGTYTLDLAGALRSAQHEVRCLIVDRDSQTVVPFPVDHVTCRANDPTADLPFDFPCFTSHPASHNTFAQLSDRQLAQYRDVLRSRLDRLIADFDPHLIHCQHIWLLGHLALETGVPYVLTAQGTDLMGFEQDARYRGYAQQAAENAGRIMAASEYIRRQVIETFELDSDRVETVLSAIDPRPYLTDSPSRPAALQQLGLPADAQHIVAYGGKLVPFKGVDVLLNAAVIYQQAVPDCLTVIAGDGIQRSELEAQARHLGLERIVFLGDLDRAHCAALFRIADVVVMPSRGEPFGLVALEAMASATPVIGTRAGGLAEIVTPRTGALVPVDDHELMAEQIVAALRENWKQTKGPAARRDVLENHDPGRWADRIIEVYRTVLNERHGGGHWHTR